MLILIIFRKAFSYLDQIVRNVLTGFEELDDFGLVLIGYVGFLEDEGLDFLDLSGENAGFFGEAMLLSGEYGALLSGGSGLGAAEKL